MTLKKGETWWIYYKIPGACLYKQEDVWPLLANYK